LPEGAFLATSAPGLVARGRTVAEALDIARDVARKLIEARRERDGDATLPGVVATGVNLPLWRPLEWAGSPDSVIVKSHGN
jgi:hypothetical protein